MSSSAGDGGAAAAQPEAAKPGDVQAMIKHVVTSNPCVLFMKGTPEQPLCGFSATVIKVLEVEGAKFKALNVLDSDELRQGIKEYSDWPTIPQLYVDGEFVGGCDLVVTMFKEGQLRQALLSCGAVVESDDDAATKE